MTTNPRIGRIAVLAGTMAVAASIVPSLGVMAPFIIEELDISRSQFGGLVTAIAGITAVSGPLAGGLVDRIGGRRVITMLAATTSLSAVLIAQSSGYIWLVGAGALSGLANAASNPSTNSLIAYHEPLGNRGLTMGIKQSGVQCAYFAVGLTLPVLATSIGWRSSIAILALPALLVAAGAAVTFPARIPIARKSRGPANFSHSSSVKWIAIYAVLMGWAGSAVTTFLALYAQEELGFEATSGGAAVATVGLFGVASRIGAAHLVEKLTHFGMPLALLAIGSAFGLAVLALAPGVSSRLLWPAATVLGATLMAWNAVANLAAISLNAIHDAGKASGYINMGFMAGSAIGPTAFGALVDHTGSYSAGWFSLSAICIVAAVLMARWTLSPMTMDAGT